MSRSSVLSVVVVLLLVVPALATAAGVRLHNRDARSYKLYVKHAGSAVHTSINKRAVTNICTGSCTISIPETGSSIHAQPGETIVIRNGQLVRRGRSGAGGR